MREPSLLSIRDLQVSFSKADGGRVTPVRSLDLELPAGKTLGLVGESGSGKSLSALAVMGMVPWPGRILSGSIRFQGRDLVGLDDRAYQGLRGSNLAIVFQDPSTALNPVLTIGEQLSETLRLHRDLGPQEARQAALEALQRVQITSPGKRLDSYPHQLSGGMKQRVLIAMALACGPACLILDEPTTALDVTVQAQLLDLIELIQNSNQTSILLISHDLAVVSEISDEISIIYAGRIVETAPTAKLLSNPRHPYTRGLLDSIPGLEGFKQPLKTIQGFPPDPADLPSGCPFHPRCFRAQSQCRNQDPETTSVNGHAFACWNPIPETGT
jgi:peptide/nickel transport system ATP-binding protein